MPQLFDILLRRQRRIFMVVLLAALGAGVAYTLTLPKEYQGVSTLFVGENRPVSTGATAVQLDDVLARTYAELLQTSSVRRAVAGDLPFKAPASELEHALSFGVVTGTRLIQIGALDRDPGRAQAIANTYAKTFVDLQQAAASDAGRGRLAALNNEIGDLALQQARLQGNTSSTAVAARARIENQLAALRQSYNLAQQSNSLQGTNVSVSSLSALPAVPAKPRTKLYIVLSAILALALASVAALVRNTFDRRVRDEDELTHLLGGVPVLARLPVVRVGKNERMVDEALDFLRANLQMQEPGHHRRGFAITSALAGDGKSTVVAGLSRAFARLGANVVAVEADLRRPGLSRLFGITASRGLTNLLVEDRSARELLGPPTLGGVRVLPAGPLPPNPSILFGTPAFGHLLDELRGEADYVVVDTPPVNAAADASEIGSAVDAVVLVVDLNASRRDLVRATYEQLTASEARLVGVVLNRVDERDMPQSYYGPAPGSAVEALDLDRSRRAAQALEA